MHKRSLEAWALVVLLAAHMVLGVYYSVVIPIWEAHDEDGHYFFVRHLATQRQLPLASDKSASANDEMHQPPLYYVLAALPVALVDVNDGVSPNYNPYMSRPFAQGGSNRVIHDAAVESWPFRGTVLAVHLARWVSVLIGALGVVFTFLAGRTLDPDRPWVRWGAALIFAFWPQYRFSTAVINNDILVTTCAAATTWLALRLIMNRRPSALHLLALCVATGLALVSKGNGLGLLPVVVLVLVGSIIGAEPALRKRLLLYLGGGLVLGCGVVGWWYARNVSSGMGFFGGERGIEWVEAQLSLLIPGRLHFPWALVLPALEHGLFSLWAGYGWNNVALPMPFYWVAEIWAVLGAAGVALWALRRPARRQAIGVAAILLLAVSLVIPPLLQVLLNGVAILHGRALLPALPAVSILLGLGWNALLPDRMRTAGWILIGGSLGILALVTPLAFISPAYAAPNAPSEAQLAEYTPAHVTFGNFAELVGYRIDDRFVDAQGTLRVKLAWRVLARTPAEYTLSVQLFEREHRQIGEVHRFPGKGAFTTSTWQPGALFTEEVDIPVDSQDTSGHQAWIEVSFFNRQDLTTIEVTDANGQCLGAVLRIDHLKVRGAVQQAMAAAPAGSLQFGSAICLVSSEVKTRPQGQVTALDVALNWLAAARPDRDYTVSIQLRDTKNVIVAQIDQQPQDDKYPTSLWEGGEAVPEQRTILLPADLGQDDYGLYVCMYDSASLQRLQVRDAQGQVLPDAEARLATVQMGDSQPPQIKIEVCP